MSRKPKNQGSIDPFGSDKDIPLDEADEAGDDIPQDKPQEDQITQTDELLNAAVAETAIIPNLDALPEAVPASARPAPVKWLKVRVMKKHSCKIGGKYYNLKAGETHNMPIEVARILLNAGVVMV